eukprot:g8289.t1
MARRTGSPGGYGRTGIERRGSFDVGTSAADAESKFRLGQRVEGKFRGRGRWYKGRIIGIKGGGKYDVRYEDNDEDLDLDASAIRPDDAEDNRQGGSSGGRDPFPTSSTSRRDGDRYGDAPALRIGARVEARVPGTARWQRATVVGENRNGTIDVRLRDGTEEKQLERKMVRALEDAGGGLGARGRDSRSSSDIETAPSRARGENYRAGDKVEARFGGRSRWFPGRVERENRDGSFHIIYDDGDEERTVEKSLMRRVRSADEVSRSGSRSPGRRVISGGGSEEDLATHYRKGDKIEARYKRGRQWFVGTIRGKDENGRYSIKYEDGDSEDGVDPGLVRNIGLGSTDSLGRASGVRRKREAVFGEGEKVEARLGGRSRWLEATIDRANRDGTFHLLYANGEEERAVEKDLIRKVDEPERGGAKRPIVRRVGDEVEARYRRGHKWYEGEVRAVNRDGTVDIRYKDGDSERDVEPSFVRSKGGTGIESLASSAGERVASRSRSPSGRRGYTNSKHNGGEEYAEGDRVEARLGGRSRWLRATVERKNRDGSYWLIYTDGEEERSVGSDLIRRMGGGAHQRPGSRSPGRRVVSGAGTDSEADPVGRTKLHEGAEIEARYKRGRKWFRGKIRRLNADGTYDINYADGDTELDVDPGLVRGLGGASTSSLATSTSSARETTRGGERGGDGRSGSGWARLKTTSPRADEANEGRQRREGGGGPARNFSRGDRVEARYRGRGNKFYKGKVSRVNSDNTLDIAYDDGEREVGIALEHVNSLESRGGDGSGGSKMAQGDRVEARYRGKGTKFYKGKISRVNSDDTFDIAYDDGDKEIGIAPEHVNSLEPRVSVGGRGSKMAKGDRVEARYRGKGTKFYKGKISRVNSDDTFDIVYDDGDKDIGIAPEHVNSLDPAATGGEGGGRRSKIAKGDRVEARYRGKGTKFYKGKISRVNSDDTFDIAYDDGDREIGIALEHVNSLEPTTTDRGGRGRELAKGDRVEARYRGKGTKFYKGKILRVNSDETFDIAYDDGEKDIGIATGHVRSLEPQNSTDGGRDRNKASTFSEGDKVEANFRGRGRYFPGRISRVHRDGTYDIDYDDGERERMVEASLLKVSEKDSAKQPGNGRFEEGMRVEARYKGRSRYYPGKITRVHRDNTCDIDYDDGERERMVESSFIKPLGDSNSKRAGSDRFEEGMKVEARYKGRSRFYPGKITRAHRDGSYDIDYDDGESERMVEPSMIKLLRSKRNEGLLEEGMKVEARYKGRSRYYPGSITRVYRDGTCDIDYDDGERERGVTRDLVRAVDRKDQHIDADGPQSHDEGGQPRRPLRGKADSMDSLTSGLEAGRSYAVGEKVEARLGGRSRWFKATVERENRDGTYYLVYAQGDRERAVDKNLIRSSGAAGGEGKRDEKSGTETVVAHRVGDEIEARYKRGRKWYPGKVRAVNLDGSYDVRYQDGDFERNVEASFVRRIGGASVDRTPSDFSAGDKVEGRFGGGSRWFKATVERRNRDGTFCLLYADGDEERAVERDCIRKLDADSGGERPQSSSGRGAARKIMSRAGSETGTDVDRGERKDGGSGGSRGVEKKRELPRAGEEVEARYRGGSRWQLGKVTRVHRDGSCDIEYEDGKNERNVPESHVRKAGNTAIYNSDSDSDCRQKDWDTKQGRVAVIVEGDRVEARLRGRSTWHKGEVTRVHSDGTYDVRYSRDGQLEKRVEPRLVRLPQGIGSPVRDRSRGRGETGSSSEEEERRRGSERGRHKKRDPTTKEPASEDAEAAATKLRRGLRNAGKTVDDFARKLERVRRASGGRDARGRSVVGRIDQSALERVLAGIGVELSSDEARAIRRCCPDADNDGCIDPSTLASLIKTYSTSPARRPRSSGSRTRGGRRPSSFAVLSDQSVSESGTGGAAATARGRPVRGASRSRRRGAYSSSDTGSSGSIDGRHGRSRSREQRTERRSSSLDTRRKTNRGSTGGAGTSSESEGGGNSSSGGRGGADTLVSKAGLRALKKLEGPAFDGSLRREYDALRGGRHRELSTSSLKPLLRHLRVKLEESPLAEVTAILDPEDAGSFSLADLLEAALSTAEGRKVSKIHGAMSEQLFKASGKRKDSREAKGAIATFSKALTKMEDPKGSRLLRTGDLKKLVTKADFVLALGKLGLVLTHGQATTLANKHHGDYERFLAKLGDAKRHPPEEAASEGSDSESSSTEGLKRGMSWIRSLGRRRRSSATGRSRSRSRSKRGATRDSVDSSDNSGDRPLTSGSSEAGEEEADEDGDGGLLLGKRARVALRDAFEQTCSTTGGVKETFLSAAGHRRGNSSGHRSENSGSGGQESSLSGREKIRRFLRRLKLDIDDDERATLLDALAGGGHDRASGEKGVSFESDSDGTSKKRTKRGGGDDDKGGGDGDGVKVLYRDFLELLLAEQESRELSEIHGRMSKDLARAADRSSSSSKPACPFALVVKALSKNDTEGLGFVKASDFKRSLERLGFGGLSSAEKSLVVRRFDPVEEGMINCEVFGAWLSSGLDTDRLAAKLGRLLGQLTGRSSHRADNGSGGNGGKAAKDRAKARKRLLKGGVRGLFEAIDKKATGAISRHEMKGGDGMLDYEELLALASRKGKRGSASRILSKTKGKGSALVAGGKGSKREEIDDGSDERSKKDGTETSDDEDEEGGKKQKKKHAKDKRKGNKDKKGKKDDEKDGDGRRAETHHDRSKHSSSGSLKGPRLEIKLMRLRISILQQSAASDKGDNGSGDKKQDAEDAERPRGSSSSPAAVTEKWTAMFEARDRAGTGRATLEVLQGVLEEGGVKISADERSLLVSKFAAKAHGDAEGEEGAGADETAGRAPPASAAIDYDAFVRWLSEGGGLDDVLLGTVQRHLKARLSKAMDLRALFTEMCDGSSKKGDSNSRRGKIGKESLSSSGLARGLKHAGLPLDRTLVNLLVAAFSTSGGGRRHSVLSYTDFHRMVHCDGLLAGGSAMLGAGRGGSAGTLDEQIRSSLLEAVERAFAFYDEDNSNSIDATEVVNILRALGHDLTRGESRALLRKANVDRNGGVQFEGFQEAVMPFLLERARSKKLTEGEMRAMFDEIDTEGSGNIKREEFYYLFCGKLRLLSHQEAEALLGVLDRHHSGQVSWVEFVKLFEIADDETGGGGIAALPPDLKEVVAIALRKLQMGPMPDVEGQLSSFLGMPSSCRKSVLAPLDLIKELSLQWVLMPKLDSRGCIQVLVKTANLTDRDRGGSKSKRSPSRSLASTLGFGRRDKDKDTSPSPAVTQSKGTKTRRRSAILGAGLMETTTTVMKRATLQEVGASTEEGSKRERGEGGVMQVELSVKHAFGIPVARDSRMGDIRQRGMRACLFYETGREVDKDTGEASSEYSEHFLCNTYKTLAIQHPQKEEQWVFPDSSEGERKFLVRTDFGSGGDSRQGRRLGSSRNQQGAGDDSANPSPSFRGDRRKLFLLVELTCVVQTAKEETGDPYGDGLAGSSRRGGEGVRGPLKNFRAGSGGGHGGGRKGRGRRRVGGIREKGGGDDGDSDSYDSGEGSSSAEDRSSGSQPGVEGDPETASATSSDGEGGQHRDGGRGRKRGNAKKRRDRDKKNSKTRKHDPRRGSDGNSFTSNDSDNSRSSTGGSGNGRKRRSILFNRKEKGEALGKARGRRKNARSTPPPRRGRRSARRESGGRKGVRSEGLRGKSRRRRPHSSSSESESGDDSRSGESDYSRGDGEGGSGRGARGKNRGRGAWKGGWRGGDGDKRRGRSGTEAAGGRRLGDDGDEVVEVEMSCGWVLDEVMTRRYGWRAVLKAMKIEGTHKESEVEIKILPVNTLSKIKQEDIFRLPRNVILSDTFVSLVRHYREYAANCLAKRSAMGLGNVGFGAGSASSEPVLALFPRLAADPALMMALKNQWEAEVRKSHVDGRLGATISGKLVGLGLGGGAGGLTGATGAAREASLLAAFEKAVMRLWPAFCHIDAQRRRASAGEAGAESYEELESRGQCIRQILESTDSFRSDTPTNALQKGEAGGGLRGGGGDALSSVSQEGRVMVAFTLKEVAFDAA